MASTFATLNVDDKIERDRLPSPEKLFPIVVEAKGGHKFADEWFNQSITEAVDRADLVEKVQAGKKGAWYEYMKVAFREQGMPGMFAKYVRKTDWVTAKFMAEEFDKGLDHRSLETNIRIQRFEKYYLKVGFYVIGDERADYDADCIEAGLEMVAFGTKIEQIVLSNIGRVATKPIVAEEDFMMPISSGFKQLNQ